MSQGAVEISTILLGRGPMGKRRDKERVVIVTLNHISQLTTKRVAGLEEHYDKEIIARPMRDR